MSTIIKFGLLLSAGLILFGQSIFALAMIAISTISFALLIISE